MSKIGSKGGAFSSGKKVMVLKIRKAIIIYPSLLTPAVVSGSDYIHLMLLEEKKKPLSVHDINWQLKIMPGLDVNKNYMDEPLFKDDPAKSKLIEIVSRKDLGDGIHDIDEKFWGMVDKRVVKLFKKAGLEQICKVRIQNSMMKEEGVYNAFWVYSADSRYQTMAIVPGSEASGEVRTLNHVVLGKCHPNELQDFFIQDVIGSLNGKKITEKGKYCFRVEEGDVDITTTDPANPVQSFHPLVYYNNLSYANIAHLSDLHVNSRQNILAKSKARVIDYSVEGDGGTEKERDRKISPEIGSMINVCSRNIKELLERMGGDKDVDILMLSGDLIDHIKNVYISEVEDFAKYSPGVKKVWETVALDDNYEERYQAFVDYISFYSLIVDFYRKYGKPIYVVSGNHDCYLEPYGIFPRVVSDWIEANPGIPADHNLTIYEAVLAFGDSTWDELKLPALRGFFKGSMYLDKLAWFYSVLTPFSDFMLQLPNQYLAGMAWGDEEDVKGDIFDDYQQGSWKQALGHLPRADLAISDKQLDMLGKARNKNKGIILTSHFTFVSYRDEVPFDINREGDVEYDIGWDPCKYDMGTFETHRKEVYEGYLAENPSRLQCVLTGHSHRKGLYTVLRVDKTWDNSVKTAVAKLTDFPKFASEGKRTDSVVIVSDSAGPVPRCNYKREFDGWGSDNPSGSKVVFGNDGSIYSIEPVKTSVRPRFAVAMDYMDVQTKHKVFSRIFSEPVDPREEQLFIRGKSGDGDIYAFSFWWDMFPKWLSKKIYLDKILLYAYIDPPGWMKIELKYKSERGKWVIEGPSDSKLFWQYMSPISKGAFLSVKFGSRSRTYLTQYDFSDHWNFPVEVKIEVKGNKKVYRLIKDSGKGSKFPDFNWRKKLDKYK
jgi:hypothetical protein